MARSVWKGPFIDGYLLKKADKVRESGRNEVIKTWSRRSTIMPQFVGLTFGVHNGNKFIQVKLLFFQFDELGLEFISGSGAKLFSFNSCHAYVSP